MTEKELNVMAEKVADIVMKRQQEREQAIAERMAIWFFETPFKTIEDRKKEMAGMTCGEALDQLKEKL